MIVSDAKLWPGGNPPVHCDNLSVLTKLGLKFIIVAIFHTTFKGWKGQGLILKSMLLDGHTTKPWFKVTLHYWPSLYHPSVVVSWGQNHLYQAWLTWHSQAMRSAEQPQPVIVSKEEWDMYIVDKYLFQSSGPVGIPRNANIWETAVSGWPAADTNPINHTNR